MISVGISRNSQVAKFYRVFVILVLLTNAAMFCTLALSAQTPGLTSFDAPDAGTRAEQGTIPVQIAQSGAIVGDYIDSSYVTHGFFRSPAGVFTEFDFPNATGTFVAGINKSGQIAGGALTSAGSVGFVRNPNGTFVTIIPPNSTYTTVDGINDDGEVIGSFNNAIQAWLGFVYRNGEYVLFKEPNAFVRPGGGTFVCGINNDGSITGYYNDSVGTHGFIRTQAGQYTSFDPTGSITTNSFAINHSGSVTGYFYDPTTFATASFVRNASGEIISFAAPGYISTFASGINDAGAIVGEARNSSFANFGFERDATGAIFTFSVPEQDTEAASINDAAQVTGFSTDVNTVFHGFVWQK